VIVQTRCVIGVPDLKISAAYYREVLGFEIRKMAPG
jgi:catechol 2,3-dioxygenase-like lactoylglutathione lyase family enzyme